MSYANYGSGRAVFAQRNLRDVCIECEGLCPFCEIPRQSVSRGRCSKHYHEAWRQVRDGTATWEELERNGSVLTLGYQRVVNKTIVYDT